MGGRQHGGGGPSEGDLLPRRAPDEEGASPISRYDVQYKESAADDQAATTQGDPSTGWVSGGTTGTGTTGEATIWSATLTAKDLGAYFGCYATTGSECSTTSVLSDDDFTYGGVSYTVLQVLDWAGADPGFFIELDRDVTAALDGLTLHVGGETLAPSAGSHIAGTSWIYWSGHKAGWSEGDVVELKLTAPGVTGDVTGLTNLEVYDVRVRVNAQGASAWSQSATGSPLPEGTIWAAKLTAGDLGSGRLGCDNASSGTDLCSMVETLTDDDFDLEGTSYTVTEVATEASSLRFGLSAAVPDDLNIYVLQVDEAQFPIGSATIDPDAADTAQWTSDVPSWTADDVVQLQIRLGTIPTALALAPDDGKLTATWRAPFDDGGSPITSYDLEYRERGDAWLDSGHSGTDLSVDLNNFSGYEARVRAVNADGPGDWSAIAKGQPLPPGWVWVWDAALTVGEPYFGRGCGQPEAYSVTKAGCDDRLTDTTIKYRGDYTVEYINLRDRDVRLGTPHPFRFAVDRPFAHGWGDFLTLLVDGKPFAWSDGRYTGCHHCDLTQFRNAQSSDRAADNWNSYGAVRTWRNTGMNWTPGETVELGLVYRKTLWFGRYEDSTIPYDVHFHERPATEVVTIPTQGSTYVGPVTLTDRDILRIWVRLSEPAPAGGLTLTVAADPSSTAEEGEDFEILTPTVILPEGATRGGDEDEWIRIRIIDDNIEDSGETIILNVSTEQHFLVRDAEITILNSSRRRPRRDPRSRTTPTRIPIRGSWNPSTSK